MRNANAYSIKILGFKEKLSFGKLSRRKDTD
jgi:hypothetical protein